MRQCGFKCNDGGVITLDTVGFRKKKVFQIGHGRIAFYEHGGKTGMAMIKYPLYKKNNSRKNTPAYPGSRPCVLTVK